MKKNKQKILITGANGFLGGKIAKRIVEDTDYDVLAIASSKEKVLDMCKREDIIEERLHFLSNEDFLDKKTQLQDIYAAIHLAFARRSRPAADIASSLDYASAVYHRLADGNIDRVINMSSQGIYGGTEEIRSEKTIPAPENNYTMAKYASEILFNDILKDCLHHTNLRLDLVVQSQNVIKGLCRSAKEGKIILKGGRQIFSFIDGEDAARAVVAMIQTDGGWDSAYNVGWNQRRYNLKELAEIVADTAEKHNYKRPEIQLIESEIMLWAGMDSSEFSNKTGWEPKIDLIDSINKLFDDYV